jgi:UDP-2,3-diacylglucosamine pyrophosphatase LpxH
MMSRPARLAGFIAALAARDWQDEALELVVAGDFVDFLAIPPHASLTADPAAARAKLERTMREPPFDAVFTAIGKLVQRGHRLTILVGNHDLELALPPMQDAFLRHIAATPHQVRWVDDGRTYCIGGALIEHGNR